jgi:hypothetical protein
MARNDDSTERKPRRSPTQTVAHLTDDFVEGLHIPELPSQVPKRLRKAIRDRSAALLFRLDEAKRAQYHGPFEVRLVRDAHRAVLTSCELGLSEGEVDYARFRELVSALGYERTEVGFRKKGGDGL